MVFINGAHIKTSADKKKYQKEWVEKAAKVYAKRLRKEIKKRKKLGKGRSRKRMTGTTTIWMCACREENGINDSSEQRDVCKGGTREAICV